MDTVEETSIMLKEKSEDQSHAGFKNLKKSPPLMEKFNSENMASKWLQVDKSVAVEDFYSSTTVPVLIYSSNSINSNDVHISW